MSRLRRVGTLNALDFFGESALMAGVEKRKRNATVIADTDFVQVLTLSCAQFDMLVESGILSSDIISTVTSENERRKEVTRQSLLLQRPHPPSEPPPPPVLL